MKAIVLFILLLLIFLLPEAQIPNGNWHGQLNAGGQKLDLVFHLSDSPDGPTATMDVPAQSAKDIPVDEVSLEEDEVSLNIADLGISYTGKLSEEGKLEGTFTQNGYAFPLELTLTEEEIKAPTKPQDPVAPFPYEVRELTFPGGASGVTLSATLTLPRGFEQPPVAILVSGSGPQDRDEALMGHRPFLVLADHLTRKGIAVLRYDDRGVAASTGDFASATTSDFADDAEAAVTFLAGRKDIDPRRIGIVGHSEGGVVAPMVAARNEKVAFVVMLAGIGMNGADLILAQADRIGEVQGIDEATREASYEISRGAIDIALSGQEPKIIDKELTRFLKKKYKEYRHIEMIGEESREDFIAQSKQMLDSPWMLELLAVEPSDYLTKVNCPVLSVIGTKDLQVPADLNTPLIKNALSHNPNVKAMDLEGLNHLFQEAETGSPAEYAKIEQTMSPKMLELVSEWIAETTLNTN